MDIKHEPIEACPFCRGRCVDISPVSGSTTIFYPYVQCVVCQYCSPARGTAAEAIASHNAVAGKVREADELRAAIVAALRYAQDGQQDSPEVKAWGIDQMVRALLPAEGYRTFVQNWNNAPPVSIKWEEGTAP